MDAVNEATSIKIPARPEYIGVARLIIAAFAGFFGFGDEEIEDIKIAVSEACTSAILQLHKETRLEKPTVEIASYLRDHKLVIDVKYGAKEAAPVPPAEKDLGMSILTCIMDKVEIIRAKDHGTILRLIKDIP